MQEELKKQVQIPSQSKHSYPLAAQRVTHNIIDNSNQTKEGSTDSKRTFIETNNMNSVSTKPNEHFQAERMIKNSDIADFKERKEDVIENENENENEWERDFRERQDADTDRERESENSISSNSNIRNNCINSLGYRVSGMEKIDSKSYPSSPARILDCKSSSNSTTTTTSSSTSSSVYDIAETLPTRGKNTSKTQNGISVLGKGKGPTFKMGTDNLKTAEAEVGCGVGTGPIIGIEVVSRVRAGCGLGVALSEEELIELLSLPPKSCPALRTKSGYQDFFRGMNTIKMKKLLEKGYDRMNDRLRKEETGGERGGKGEMEIYTGNDREDIYSKMEASKEKEQADVKSFKIKKRMDMLRGVLTN